MLTINVTLRVHKLTSFPVGTRLFFMELFACLCHEIFRQVGLLNQLVLAVGVRALVLPFTVSIHFPVLTHLGLLFTFIFLDEFLTVSLTFILLLTFVRAGTVGAVRSKLFAVTSHADLLGLYWDL